MGASALLLAGAAFATETTTYEYDAQGRLTKSAKSGGLYSGTEKCTAYDAAGNRTNQTVNSAGCSAGGGSSGGGSSGGGSSGGGSNSPPVTVSDFIVANCGGGAVNAIANDSDPDGDPITVTAVTGGMGAYVSGGTTVGVTAATTGNLTYTIQDSNGASATGSITVFNMCGPFF